MTLQDAATQVPVHIETDNDGVLMNVCRFGTRYFARVNLQMQNGLDGTGNASNATNLPLLIVRSTLEAPDVWRVHSTVAGRAGQSTFYIAVDNPGHYRVYLKEPTETFVDGTVYTLPDHALADGTDSGRAVQPLLELHVTENDDCSLSGQKVHPNGLGRTRGNGVDQIPVDGRVLRFTENHDRPREERSLGFGNHLITHQLWADASRTYGTRHPRVVGSRFREALQLIYGETLTTEGTDRVLTSGNMRIRFHALSTNGGSRRFSFLAGNARMTRDESLRRTHPATMTFLLQMMEDLDITYALSTGAWRPHTGSSRHRYASAIDLTHLNTNVNDAQNRPHRVEIHLHNETSPNSNPSRTQPQETAARTRMREFSHRVHVYIAQARQEGTLGWLGGPWRFTYAQLGLPGPLASNRPGETRRLPDDPAIATDEGHRNHIHISMGTDQA